MANKSEQSISFDIVTKLAKIGRKEVRDEKTINKYFEDIISKCSIQIELGKRGITPNEATFVLRSIRRMISYFRQLYNHSGADRETGVSMCGLYAFILSTLCLPYGTNHFRRVERLSDAGGEIDFADLVVAGKCIISIYAFFYTQYHTRYEILEEVKVSLTDYIASSHTLEYITLVMRNTKPSFVYAYEINLLNEQVWEYTKINKGLTRYGLKSKKGRK